MPKYLSCPLNFYIVALRSSPVKNLGYAASYFPMNMDQVCEWRATWDPVIPSLRANTEIASGSLEYARGRKPIQMT